jgi:uncharacterized membrane protein
MSRRKELISSRTVLFLLLSAPLLFLQSAQPASVTFTNLKPVGRVRGINRSSLLVGSTVGGERLKGFTLQDENEEEIVVPNSIQTIVYGVENNGRLVGAYYGADRSGRAHGFLYFHGAVTTIDFPAATSTLARGINDPQRVVGEFRDDAGRWHGFLYDRGDFTRIDISGAVGTHALGINNPGDIVGYFVDGEGHAHGFLNDRTGVQTKIDVPFAGVTDTFLYGISNPGVIVGSYIDDAGTHGFIDINGLFTTVDAPDTPPGIGTFVQGINDNGQLAVFGVVSLLGQLVP